MVIDMSGTEVGSMAQEATALFAEIADGVVVNLTLAAPSVAQERGWIAVAPELPVSVGDTYDGQDFSPPPPPPLVVPEAVTRAQAKIALARAGLYEQVVAIIAAAPLEAQIWWGEADTFRRDNQWVAAIGAQIGLTVEQVDALFITAAAIE